MKQRSLLLILLGIFLFTTGVALYLRTPLFYRHLAYILEYKYGFTIYADNVRYSPFLKAEISNLQIANLEKDKFFFASTQVNFESKPSAAIRGEIEKITLKEPKIQIRIGDKKETETDLSFIKKIPPVHLLIMQKGEFKLIFGATHYELTFKDIDLDVKGFSPDKGGNVTFRGLVDITGKEPSEVTGSGRCKGSMNLTGLFPAPIGTGLLEISLNSGVFKTTSLENAKLYLAITFGKERITVSRIDISADSIMFKNGPASKSKIKNPLLKAIMVYELKPKTLIVDRFQCEIPSLGTFKGYYSGTMKDIFPWKAAVDAADIDFTTLFAYLKPFIEKPGDEKWSIQGKGALKSEMEGALKGKDPTLSGKATLQFRKGGFSSADGTKAAQGIEGTMVLKFSIPSESKKSSAQIYSEVSSGEYLFGKYYKDLSKEKNSISADTDISISDKHRFDFKGSLNLFDTGKYTYAGSLDKEDWNVSFSAEDISSDKLLSITLYDYLSENHPTLKDLRVKGTMSTEVRLTGRGEGISLHGNVRLNDISILIPEKSVSAKNISMNLPFDLHYPSKIKPGIRSKSGELYIGTLEKDALKLSDMTIPFLVTANNILIPGEFELPFYGGKIKIIECRGEDVLVPSRKFNFAAKIENVDISSLLEELTGLQLPGNVEAQFPLVGYEDGRWITKGATSVKIFGGFIEVENVQIKNLFSQGRTMRGNIAFYDIDLGKITDTIKIGKIKGVINGFIKNLEIEYGQPSSFVLEIDSIKKSGIEQKISVDAIENISIIGTGSGAVGSILKSGINSFFKEYPYSRIGIKCILENDNFHLSGKIHEGGTEYFIRRGFLRGIDVVNMASDNTISFQDMQERVWRIFKKDGDGPTFTTSMN
ncbi:MAG: hypothetical protein NTX75_05315 [Proteobacteria bacterium]|nr:hypothetical protein [Pseudomonadota bacterium]